MSHKDSWTEKFLILNLKLGQTDKSGLFDRNYWVLYSFPEWSSQACVPVIILIWWKVDMICKLYLNALKVYFMSYEVFLVFLVLNQCFLNQKGPPEPFSRTFLWVSDIFRRLLSLIQIWETRMLRDIEVTNAADDMAFSLTCSE